MATGAKRGKMRKPMSRKTKIRKRIFGVTSLILAVLVAAIPVNTRAAYTPVTGGRLQSGLSTSSPLLKPGIDSRSQEDASMGLTDSVSSMTYDGTKVFFTVNTASPVADALTDGYKAAASFSMKYFWYDSGRNDDTSSDSTKVYRSIDDWGSDTKLYMGVTGIENILTQPDNWAADSYKTNYGQAPKLIKFAATAPASTFTGPDVYSTETSVTQHNWSEYAATDLLDPSCTVGADGKYTEWGGIPIDFTVQHVTLAYRPLMEIVEDRIAGNKTDGTPMASAKATSAAGNGDYKMRLSSVMVASGDNSALKQAIIDATGVTSIPDTDYYEWNASLLKKSDDSVASHSDTVALSMPLPASMKRTEGTYSLYKLADDGTATPITPFYEVALPSGNNWAIQFETKFEGKTEGYNFAVVLDRQAPSYTVTAGTNPVGGTVTLAPNQASYTEGSDLTVTAPDMHNGLNFSHWEEAYTGTGTVTGQTSKTLQIDSIQRDYVLTAVYGDAAPMPNTGTLIIRTQGEGTGLVGTTPGGYQIGEHNNITLPQTFTFTASPQPNAGTGIDSEVTGWTYRINDGTEETAPAGTLTLIMETWMTKMEVTAVFEPKKYNVYFVDNRSTRYGTTDPTMTIVPERGRLEADTTVRATTPASADIPQQFLTDIGLRMKPTNADGYDIVDFFKLTTDHTINVPNTTTITNLSLPSFMKLSEAAELSLFYNNAGTAVQVTSITENEADNTITFSIENPPIDGDYVLAYKRDPAKANLTVVEARVNPVPPTDSTKGTVRGLTESRVLTVKDDAQLKKDAEIPLNDLLYETDADGNAVKKNLFTGFEGFVGFDTFQTTLEGTDNTGATVTKNDAGLVIDLNVPIATSVNAEGDAVKVFKVTKDTSGNYTGMTPMTATAVAQSNTSTQVTVTLREDDFNGEYIVVYRRSPEFYVREDDREDQRTGISYATPSPRSNDDRYLVIKTNYNNNTIEAKAKADPDLKDYTVVPYEIRYVDGAGNDATDFDRITVGLTIPNEAKGAHDIKLISVDTDGTLQKTNSNTHFRIITDPNAGGEVTEFSAYHLSEFGIAYLRDAPVPQTFNVSLGGITPAGDNRFSVTIDPNSNIPAGETTTVTATTTAPGYVFDHWEREDSQGNRTTGPTTSPWTFAVNDNYKVYAVFRDPSNEPVTYTVTALADGPNDGTVTVVGGTTGRVAGQPVIVTAAAAENREIESWEDNGQIIENSAGRRTYTIPSLEGNHAIIVHFKESATPPAATYTVEAIPIPNAGGTVTGGGTGLAAGSSVTLTATPAAGYQVANWTDNAAAQNSTATTYTISNLDKDHTVIVEFRPVDDSGGGNSGGGNSGGGGTSGGGTVTPTSSTSDGGTASASDNGDGTWKLTAVPQPGYKFDHWEGPNGRTSTDNPLTITPSGNENWKAVFTKTDSGTSNTSGGNVTVTQDTQSGTGTGTTTGGGSSGGTGSTTNQGKNANDMPKTGLFDQFGTYKMIAIILLVLFGAIELLGTVNTKKQRVPVQN